jgi:hypothetical protein
MYSILYHYKIAHPMRLIIHATQNIYFDYSVLKSRTLETDNERPILAIIDGRPVGRIEKTMKSDQNRRSAQSDSMRFQTKQYLIDRVRDVRIGRMCST